MPPRRKSSGPITSGTQSLLQDMMNQSGLTAFQKRQLTKTMQSGGPLPETVKPTTSAADTGPARARKAPAVRVNMRTYQGGKRQVKQMPKVTREVYRPDPIVDAGAKKEYTQDVLMYGRDMADKRKALREKAKRGQLVERAKPQKEEPTEDGSFAGAVQEVAELTKYLEDMEGLGTMDAGTRADIKLQISQAIRKMEIVDQKRRAQVAKARQGGLTYIGGS